MVGEVRAMERHPNADRLTVCQVDAGTGQLAEHRVRRTQRRRRHESAVRAGRSELAGRSARGKPSRSSSATHARRGEPGHAVLGTRARACRTTTAACWRSTPDAPLGRDVRDYAALWTITSSPIKLTPNRADCLSVLGVAREVAALTRSAAARSRDIPDRSRRRATTRSSR